MTSVIPYPAASDEPEDFRPSKLRAHLERQALPSPARVAQSARWWATDGSKGVGVLLLKLPLLALFELKPIFRGLGRLLVGFSRWIAVSDHAERLTGADDKTQKAAERLESRKEGRRRLTLVLLVVLTGVTWWAVVVHPEYLVVAAFVVVCGLDLVGRRGQVSTQTLPPPMRAILKEGVPLSQITAAVVDTLLREGLEVGISRELRYDASRHEYRMQLSSLDEIKPEHLRAIERGIGADDHTIRNLATGTATVRELVIRDGDPLASVDHPDWVETGSVSINDALDLGESVTETPFAIRFAGVHVAVVGQNGSGKSKGLLWAAIDRISACRDAVLVGIDLAGGPALPMWGKVIRKTAYTPDDAEVLLNWAIGEMDRRMAVLKAIAEDEDPENDADEWHSGLGPAIVIVIDEFAMLVEHNGEKGRFDLLGKVMTLHRVGRKVWLSFLEGTQKTGNSDFGSKVIDTQVKVRIMMACAERDTVTMLGTEARDSGWAPHLLSPATEAQTRDAGKCYVSGPEHRTPDIYRTYRPMRGRDVKLRAARRIADGIPTLEDLGYPTVVPLEVEGAVVPPMLAAAEKVFADAGNPDWMPTRDLLAGLAGEFPGLTENGLSAGMGVARDGARRRLPDGTQPRGYTLVSILAALEAL